MKFLQAVTFATILALWGGPLSSAQEPQSEKEKQQPDEKKKPPPPAKAHPKTEQQPKPEPQPDREKAKEKQKQDQDQTKQQDRRKEQEKADKREQKQSPAESSQTATSRPGDRKNVRRIPQEHFQANFGHQHHFRVARRNDRRFQYSGYWFEYVEVWPAEWSYEDDCYIEEDGDDYYLVNVAHPGVRILVVIVS
jgi:outer membrane biosynthesis protein TonB